MNSQEIIEKLKAEVKANYLPYKCGWTSQRSEGNYDDCFNDGCESGSSYTWYEVGCILGMDLKEPEEPECEY